VVSLVSALDTGFFLTSAVLIAASMAAVPVRLRVARGIERQQIKLLYGGGVAVVITAVGAGPCATGVGALLTFAGLLGAIAVAIFRYRLTASSTARRSRPAHRDPGLGYAGLVPSATTAPAPPSTDAAQGALPGPPRPGDRQRIPRRRRHARQWRASEALSAWTVSAGNAADPRAKHRRDVVKQRLQHRATPTVLASTAATVGATAKGTSTPRSGRAGGPAPTAREGSETTSYREVTFTDEDAVFEEVSNARA
jgi:hypothetical protein